MSHSHSHAPGQPSHSHGPAPPQAVQGGQPPKQVMPQPDPVMQAVIEASFKPVDIALGPPDNVVALCEKHSREICADCDVNFVSINQISRLLHMNPAFRCPPPPQMITQKLSQAVNSTKDEGNALFKAGQYAPAAQRYTVAANLAVQRPPWEIQGVMREELSTNLSNRSAAYFEGGEYLSALVDAETVIQLRKPWSKGYFRKAKALLKLEQFEDARETIESGLSFEPDNQEMLNLLATVESALKERLTAKTGEKTLIVDATA